MKRSVLAFGLLAAAVPALAITAVATPPVSAPPTPVVAAAPTAPAVEVVAGDAIRVIDGDTVAIPCGPDVPHYACEEKVRFVSIDAPEIFHVDCQDAYAVGLRAKARVEDLLRGQNVDVHRSGRKDRYGRTLADISVPAGDVGAILVREGLALVWSPGPKAKAARIAVWCGRQP